MTGGVKNERKRPDSWAPAIDDPFQAIGVAPELVPYRSKGTATPESYAFQTHILGPICTKKHRDFPMK
jgi:hypothetical protein